MTQQPVTRQVAFRQTEAAPQPPVELWHATLDAIEDGIAVMDPEQKITLCNRAMLNLLGKPFGHILGSPCFQLVHGTSQHIKGCPLVRVRQTRQREVEVVPLGDRWFQTTVDPLMNEAAELVGYVHVMSDVTARRQAEKRAQRNLQRMTALHK